MMATLTKTQAGHLAVSSFHEGSRDSSSYLSLNEEFGTYQLLPRNQSCRRRSRSDPSANGVQNQAVSQPCSNLVPEDRTKILLVIIIIVVVVIVPIELDQEIVCIV